MRNEYSVLLGKMLIMKNKYDLAIVRVDRIGDYVLWHDTLSAYKKKYAGKKVLLICPSALTTIVREESFFFDIITYDHQKAKKSHGYLIKLFFQMRSISSEEVIYPSWRRSVLGDIIVSGIRSRHKIGMQGVPDVEHSCTAYINRFFNSFYSQLVENPDTSNEINAIEYFTRKIVSEDYCYGTHKLESSTPNPVCLKKYAVVAFSAYNKFRIWSMEKFVQLIDHIPLDYEVVLSGYGAEDEERADFIIANIKEKKRIVNMVGKTTIPQLISLIDDAVFVIGNDSSAIHIAAATQTPSLCILPGAHYGRFVPYPDDITTIKYKPKSVFYKMDCYGCNYSCTRPITDSYECLRQITVDMAVKELDSLLKELGD